MKAQHIKLSLFQTLILLLLLLKGEAQSVNLVTLITVPTITPTIMNTLLSAIDQNIFTATNPSIRPIQIRKFLRAAFHDSMGGLDGSINLQNSDNRGLEVLVNGMNTLYKNTSLPFSQFLTRPDFWALVMGRALGWGIANSGNIPPALGPSIPVFSYGRFNNTQSPSADTFQPVFPDGNANWTSTSGPISILSAITIGLKGFINESQIITLLGLHSTGIATELDSGFQGPWGAANDRNHINNNLYNVLLGYQGGRNFSMTQVPSNNSNIPTNPPPPTPFSSPNPTFNKLQWVNSANPSVSKIMLNVDMGFYHSFTAAADGKAPGKYCPQINNVTQLFNCNQVDPSYMPLSKNAQQAFTYVKSLSTFYYDLYLAFNALTTVPSEFDGNSNAGYIKFYPAWVCNPATHTYQCMGDVYLQNCRGYPIPSTPC